MSFEIPWLALEELVDDIIDRRGVTPLKLGGDFTESGHRVISAKLLKAGRVDLQADEPRYVNATVYAKWMKGPLLRGDVLMTSEAPLGELAFVDKTLDWCLGQRLFAIRPKKHLLDGCYAFYALQTPKVREDLLGRATGTTVQGIRQSELRRVKLPVPDLPFQLAAAGALKALDDRIYLLRETNATLEAIAQALFKSWFVDFDPVRAKSQGLAPAGMDEATAALFPDGFEESAQGINPCGWKLTAIYDLATYINGAAYKAFQPNAHRLGLPIIKIAELKGGVTGQTAFSEVAMPEKYLIQTGDILFSWSGNPDTSIDTFVWAHEPAWLNQHIFRVLPHKSFERAFVLSMLRQLRPVFAELARNKQTTGLGHVTVADMKRLFVAKPPPEVLVAFGDVAGPIQSKVLSNEHRIQTLATLRDTLLPRLISGQLRLPEAIAEAEEAL